MSFHFNLTHSHHVWVPGTPVPWSASDIYSGVTKAGKRFRGARKNPLLTEWQEKIQEECRKEWPYEPHRGPIYLRVQVELDGGLDGEIVIPKFKWSESRSKWCKQGGLPDQTNLFKAVEDAVAGTFYLDDIQVRAQESLCLWSEEPGVKIHIGFIDPVDPFMDLL